MTTKLYIGVVILAALAGGVYVMQKKDKEGMIFISLNFHKKIRGQHLLISGLASIQ